jgi:hypothetical protein
MRIKIIDQDSKEEKLIVEFDLSDIYNSKQKFISSENCLLSFIRENGDLLIRVGKL